MTRKRRIETDRHIEVARQTNRLTDQKTPTSPSPRPNKLRAVRLVFIARSFSSVVTEGKQIDG